MFKLSDTPVKDEYKANKGKDVLLGADVVYLLCEEKSTKSGSWERGFKFGSVTYGILKRKVTTGTKVRRTYFEFSFNHGATWHKDVSEARKSKGKVIVERSTPRGEFAFSSIQRINREYDPNYKWKA